MNPLVTISVVTGITAPLFLGLTLIAKLSDKLPKRGRRMAIMMLVAGPSLSPAMRGIETIQTASGRFIILASLGHCGLARSGSPAALCSQRAIPGYRASMAFSNQSAARSISPQKVWKIAKPKGAP